MDCVELPVGCNLFEMKQWSAVVFMVLLAALLISCASEQSTPGSISRPMGARGPITVDPTPPSPGMMRGKM
jgi:hypothetical protein